MALTKTQKNTLRRNFATGNFTKVALGIKFGVSARTVGRVLAEETEKVSTIEIKKIVETPTIEVGTLLVAKTDDSYIITNTDAVVNVVSMDTSQAIELGCKWSALPEDDVVVMVASHTTTPNKVGSVFTVQSKYFDIVGKYVDEDVTPVAEVVEPEPEVETPHVPEVAYNITAMAIALTIDGVSNVIDMTHQNFQAARLAIIEERFDDAASLMDISKAISSFSDGKLVIADGEITFEGQAVAGALVDKILGLMADGKEGFKPFALFLERVLQNDSFKARNRLMEFAAANDIGIHTDGRLVAFKNVREDGFSSRAGKWVQNDDGKWVHDHDQKYFHDIGEVLTMPRNEVDDNEDNTCSSGLHVCSAQYLKRMWGTSGKTFKVAVCPSDIVAIPPDYNNSKARTCRYEVIEDVSGTKIEEVINSI